MGDTTKIQWCDYTFNPWRGCTKVSPGCANCYAEAGSKRNPIVLGEWGPKGRRAVAAESYWRKPARWNRDACERARLHARHGLYVPPPRVFCASLADWLEDRRDLDQSRARLLSVIASTRWLNWLLLTKRPENWRSLLGHAWNVSPTVTMGKSPVPMIDAWLNGQPPDNVWLGVSVENQANANERIPELLKIPARVRFLSVEPLLGHVNLRCVGPERWDVLKGWKPDAGPEGANTSSVDWVIVGGESGHGARQCDLVWVRSLVEQCRSESVACFVKQLGALPYWGWVLPPSLPLRIRNKDHWILDLSDPKGGDPEKWPEDLRVREFPNFQGDVHV